MLANGIRSTVLDLTVQNSPNSSKLRFPYRFVLQDASEEGKPANPGRHFRWTHVMAQSLRRIQH
jgi:hypothetical protein